MRQARVYNHGQLAGFLIEKEKGEYEFCYEEKYAGPPVSLGLPLAKKNFTFDTFPPFFEGLLPEGTQLEALLKKAKIDRYDLFSQLVTVGGDLVGSITVEEI